MQPIAMNGIFTTFVSDLIAQKDRIWLIMLNYIEKLYKLTGRTALITGGGGVLAGAIGCGLAQAGVKIILADINLEKARANAETIIKKSCAANEIYMDALDPSSIKDACNEILKENERSDILINAAGGNIPGATISPDKTIFDMDLEDFNSVSDLNYKIGFMLHHAVDKPRFEDLVTGIEKPLVRDGYVKVPENPGIGVELNEDVVKEFLLEGEELFAPTPQWDEIRSNDRLWS